MHQLMQCNAMHTNQLHKDSAILKWRSYLSFWLIATGFRGILQKHRGCNLLFMVFDIFGLWHQIWMFQFCKFLKLLSSRWFSSFFTLPAVQIISYQRKYSRYIKYSSKLLPKRSSHFCKIYSGLFGLGFETFTIKILNASGKCKSLCGLQ